MYRSVHLKKEKKIMWKVIIIQYKWIIHLFYIQFNQYKMKKIQNRTKWNVNSNNIHLSFFQYSRQSDKLLSQEHPIKMENEKSPKFRLFGLAVAWLSLIMSVIWFCALIFFQYPIGRMCEDFLSLYNILGEIFFF